MNYLPAKYCAHFCLIFLPSGKMRIIFTFTVQYFTTPQNENLSALKMIYTKEIYVAHTKQAIFWKTLFLSKAKRKFSSVNVIATE